MQKIILASHSPRRRQILELANVPFIVSATEIDESYPPGLAPEKVAVHIAGNKARATRNRLYRENEEPSYMGLPVLSADTIVVLDNEIIGKPAGRNEAIQTLQKLSGKKHIVITGVVIVFNDHQLDFAVTTEVEFYEISDEKILYYIDRYKPFDKAGAYAIQEWIGAVAIKSINGDFYNVMGLPVSRVLIELQKIKK